MKREIKFRAWHPLQKVMYFNHSVSVSIDGTVHYLDTDGEWNCDIKGNGEDVGIVLMQYTGLKDKNGKEIFDGDITCNFDSDRSPYFFHEVVFENGCFGYYTKESGFHSFASNGYFGWVGGQSNEIEVIGNIYENPELLNKNNEQ